MRRKLLVSLLVASVVSLASGAMWQPLAQETAPLPALTAEQAVLLSQLMFDEECADLTDYQGPPNRLACELDALIDYLLGLITCSEYVDRWILCQSISS